MAYAFILDTRMNRNLSLFNLDLKSNEGNRKAVNQYKKTCFICKLHILTEIWMSSRNQGGFHFNDVKWGIIVYLLGPTS